MDEKDCDDVDDHDERIYEPIIRRRIDNACAADQQRRRRFTGITIPEPFKMTLRDEISLIKRLSKKESETDRIECLKQFRATPVPAHVYLPLYETMSHERERKSAKTIEQRRSRLLASQQPFSFLDNNKRQVRHIGRHRRSNSVPNLDRMDENQSEKRANVDNRDGVAASAEIPRRKLFAKSLAEITNEEKLLRECRIRSRAEKLLKTSSLPPSMQERMKHKSDSKVNEVVVSKVNERKKVKTVASTTVPPPVHNYQWAATTIVKSEQPFRRRSRTVSDYDDLNTNNFLVTPKMTSASMKREATNQKRVQEEKEHRELKSIENYKKQKDLDKLKQTIAKKATMLTPKTDSENQADKLRNFREADKARRKDYRQEMKDMMERVNSRPLLLEQQLQMSATRRVERRFNERLQQCGVDQDLLLKLSHQANPKYVKTSLSLSSVGDPEEDKVDSEFYGNESERSDENTIVDDENDRSDADASEEVDTDTFEEEEEDDK